MVGAILIVVILLAIPVGLFVGGAVIAALLGTTLKIDGDVRHEGSELVELNR
jgi:hypothetical protein